jgi:hypothetical protein
MVMFLAWTSSPTNSSFFFMACLLFVGFIIGDAASAVIPQRMGQGTVPPAQPATLPLLQAHRFPFQKTLRSRGGQP